MARSRKRRLIHLDTHVVCWLYAGRVDLLSPAAREAIERDVLAVSPMVGLELQYLREIGRILHGPNRVLAALRADLGLSLSELPFAAVAARARALIWTRDPFDRLIASQAVMEKIQLMTCDKTILKHCPLAFWR